MYEVGSGQVRCLSTHAASLTEPAGACAPPAQGTHAATDVAFQCGPNVFSGQAAQLVEPKPAA